MAIPNAPTEGAGDKIIFVAWDNGGITDAALLSARQTRDVNDEKYADLDVYPTSGTVENGGQLLTGATAQSLVAGSIPCQGLVVKARVTNAGTIYVGASDVTADADNATGGFPLEPGESASVPCRDVGEVYVIGTSGDGVAWIASAD